MSDSVLVGVTSDKIEAAWPHVVDLIQRACERSRGRHTAEGFKKRLLDRDQQLWLSWNEGVEALAVSEIITWNDTGLKSCRLVIATGKSRRNWARFHELIGEWAKSQGCTILEAAPRPGWERELPTFRKTHVFLERAL